MTQQEKLEIAVKANRVLTSEEYAEIVALTSQAFKRDYTPFLEMFVNPSHILGRYHGQLVSYVLWITRWMQIGDAPPMRTAYIEGMATEISHRHKGFASQVMKTAIDAINDYDIAALATGSVGFYRRLGWQVWQGPLYCRKEKELIAMPGEQGCVMVYALPQTPPLDLKAPASIEWRAIEPW
jgi:aminoglycoside 2'-N-acetyltransferase I